METDATLTVEFLNSVSQHLSNRAPKMEYRVTILDSGKVSILPDLWFCKSRYDRKESSKMLLAEHVARMHLEDVAYFAHSDGSIYIPKLVSGVYRYKYTSTKKSRHWVKEKEITHESKKC